jgi:amino acid adenylation domain-containing protein/non-ribosomal peptide synthase protein (TIGR01720 family)
LLEAGIDETERAVESLEMLLPEEKRRLLVEWNRTEVEYGGLGAVHELFEKQVYLTPDAIAVIHGERQLTYRELNARANQLAHYLRRKGLRPEMLVGVLMERSVELVTAFLGVLKAGGAYLPLDSAYPPERIRFMLDDAQISLLITQKEFTRETLTERTQLVCLDAESENIVGECPDNPTVKVNPEYLAYVNYTSGSTGLPKGTAIPHRSVIGFMVGVDYVRFDALQRSLQYSSISWDALTLELWPALTHGGCCVLYPGLLPTPQELGKAIKEHGINTLWITASFFNAVIEEMPEALADVEQIMTGGEAQSRTHVRRALDMLGETQLVNGYGPSECTVFTCCYPIPNSLDGEIGPILIGKPIGDRVVYLLDRWMNPAPVGVVGEIYIAGASLARGYLKRAALTAEKFVAGPYGEPGSRIYRTGDLARWHEGGNLEFVRRIDHQVKIRGHRIEPGEIEAVLKQHPNVKEAVVLAREDEPGEKRLVAYVVLEMERQGKAESGGEWVSELKSKLRESLPEYMVPVAIVELQRLPLTANGKVDRNTLPAPGVEAYLRRGYEAPVGEIEQRMARIWSEALKVERIGRHDHFFELGGHSLLAVIMVERMRREGLRTDVRTLFTHPTLTALAGVIGASQVVDVPPNRIPAQCERLIPEMLTLVELTTQEIELIVKTVPGGASNVQDIYPLAPLQEGILFEHLLGYQGDVYLLRMLLGFESEARLESFINALQSVIGRHDILRTAVVWEGLSEPVQVVWREAPLSVHRFTPEPEAGSAVKQLQSRSDPRRMRLDVRQAPMMRAYMAYDPAGRRWLLSLLVHHLVLDHTTIEVLIQEVRAHLVGEARRLSEPVPFRNFVAQARLSISREEHERFFREMLADIDEPTAPFGLLDVQGDGTGITESRCEVEAELGRRMRARARLLGVSAASLCHLAWAQVLARATGREDVVFGTVLLGRMHSGEGADRMPGMFINTLPVRIKIGAQSLEAGVRQTHALLADLLRHEHASLSLAQRSSGVPAPAPLFTSLLNYRHSLHEIERAAAGTLAGWRGIEILASEERTNYPMTLSVDDMGAGFRLTVQAQRPIEADRVCGYMRKALEELVSALEQAPQRAICELDVLPAAEREQLVVEWNATEAGYPADRSIHVLFEEQAARTPHTIAVVDGERSLSYAELNRRANQLAHHLQEIGVGPEARVGICLERSLEMMIGILGILKAGGVYLPLDPAYPKPRLSLMLEDSAPLVVVTRLELVSYLPESRAAVVCIDGDWERIERQSEVNPISGVSGANGAYVIYTSGSTGRPKGVLGLHRGAVNRCLWMWERYPFEEWEVCCQKTSLNFVDSVWEVFGPLLSGIRSVAAPEPVTKDPVKLSQLLEEHGVTRLVVVPSMLNLLLERYRSQPGSEGVRLWISSGERLSRESAQSFEEVVSWGRLLNLYGSSEVSADVSWSEVRESVAAGRGVTIGRAIANTRLYVLDRKLQPTPVGVPGELYVGGEGLARGYVESADLTAERFVPDGIGGIGGERLYKTGDLCRYLADGEIEYVGRTDYQVNVRGYRIELEEVEAVLREQPGVSSAAVALKSTAGGQKRLVGYVVSRDGVKFNARLLREGMRKRLPVYMAPAIILELKQLPLTSNGKLDRRQLPEPELMKGEGMSEAPRTPVERALVEIWQEAFRASEVGIDDNFFELGGDSILSIQIVARANGAGLRLTPKQVFDHQTIRELATVAEVTSLIQQTPEMTAEERNYWLAQAAKEVGKLPVDHQEGDNCVERGRSVSVELDDEQTRRLLEQAPERYRIRIQEVLLTALGHALSGWSGHPRVKVEVEGNGRDEVVESVDVARRVGWFTTLYPVVLELGGSQGVGERLKAVKEQLRGVPHGGIGYGLLRYGDDLSVREELERAGSAEVSFNYLGQWDQALDEAGIFSVARESKGAGSERNEKRGNLLQVIGRIAGGRLQLGFGYSEAAHERETIESLAESCRRELEAILEHCEEEGAGGYTPSDFPLSGLDQESLDRLVGNEQGTEDIYPLSPMQQGLLFHTLYEPEAGLYFNQVGCYLSGKLNLVAFEYAWQEIVNRHPVLRTRFVWEQVVEPLQIVHHRVNPEWERQDWRGLKEAEQQDCIQGWLDTDRQRGFDMKRAPLIRFALLRLSQESYYFNWSYHHLLLDGWSVPVLIREVFSLYDGYCQGQQIQLPAHKPYRNYIAWLQRRDPAAGERFWKQLLSGFSSPTSLAQSLGRWSEKEGRESYQEERLELSKELTSRLERLAQRQRLTMNSLAQGAWALLLSCYTGQEDVLFGTVVSGRPGELEGVETIVGLLINTLPVRVQVRGGELLIDWLKKLQDLQVEMQQYDFCPPSQLHGWSDVPRGMPLFESLLVFANYPQPTITRQVEVSAVSAHGARSLERTNYPLVVAFNTAAALSINLTYDQHIFEAEAIRQILAHYRNVLESLVERPDQPIWDLSILTEPERRLMLYEGDSRGIVYPGKLCLHQWFEAQVKRFPDKEAVVYESILLTYRELNRRANQVAHYLQRLGLTTGGLAGMYVDRSPEMIIGILSILKAGGSYVPIDTTYPGERSTLILKSTGAQALLTLQPLLGSLPEHEAETICLDTEWGKIAQESDDDLSLDMMTDSLAYVIHTSGSTGMPKGVMVTHYNAARLFEAAHARFNFSERDVWTHFHSYAFDFSVWEMWGALLYGGRLVVVPYRVSRSPDSFHQLLEQEQVTVLSQTPSAFRQLMQAEERLEPVRDSALRMIILGGEALELQSLKPWFDRHGDRRPQLINMYGITETTVHVTFRPLAAADLSAARGSVIGHPIPDLQIHILDQYRRRVPIAVPGEVYVGGAGVARGYLHHPELSAEQFIADPYSNSPGARLYKTGDLARYLPDGDIEYLGRVDDQVKIRGFRIEPREICAALNRHLSVQESIVIVREDSPQEKQLVAYVVPNPGQEITDDELWRFLRQKLPDFMVPSAFVEMSSLPVNRNGKVDRRLLPSPNRRRSTRSEYVAPESEAERLVASVWKEILGVDRIGLHDNFFEIGGHSILMVKLFSRLFKLFPYEFGVVDLFGYPDVYSMAKFLNDLKPQDPVSNSALNSKKVKKGKKKQGRILRKRRPRAQAKDGEEHE